MKWHKFDVDFWTSETAHLIQKEMGHRGLVIWLRLISGIAKDLNSWSDVCYAHDFGWKKPPKEWAKIAGCYQRDVILLLKVLSKWGKVTLETTESGLLKVKFKNFGEFVHRDALSSKVRSTRGRPKPNAVAGHEGKPWRAIDKDNSCTPAAAGPVGSPGRPTGSHGVDSNGWKISDREQQIIERAELAKREEDLEEPVFAPVYVEPEAHDATWVDPDLVQAIAKPLNDSAKFLAQQAYVEEQKRQARKILEGSGGSLGLPTGPAPAKAGGPN